MAGRDVAGGLAVVVPLAALAACASAGGGSGGLREAALPTAAGTLRYTVRLAEPPPRERLTGRMT